jgi:hypothetical protein
MKSILLALLSVLVLPVRANVFVFDNTDLGQYVNNDEPIARITAVGWHVGSSTITSTVDSYVRYFPNRDVYELSFSEGTFFDTQTGNTIPFVYNSDLAYVITLWGDATAMWNGTSIGYEQSLIEYAPASINMLKIDLGNGGGVEVNAIPEPSVGLMTAFGLVFFVSFSKLRR